MLYSIMFYRILPDRSRDPVVPPLRGEIVDAFELQSNQCREVVGGSGECPGSGGSVRGVVGESGEWWEGPGSGGRVRGVVGESGEWWESPGSGGRV